ncbi:hypothetical protein FACS1894170_03460 [Planctomycetales bacterium]|nr:hypothetical protein FACS1894170_03460 [Planctomycetales bacterium]
MKNLLPLIFLCFIATSFAAEVNLPNRTWLFAYFTPNDKEGLHFAWSADGLKWTALRDGKIFLKTPQNVGPVLRDPSVLRGPDGTFHLVWTGSWKAKNLGYASSNDLINWSEAQSIPVMAHEPTTRNVWAPELFYDDKAELFYIIWASTIPDKFTETAKSSEDDLNHRLYYTTTKDFKTFAETKSYWDPGHSVIDAFLAKDGDRYLLFYKDETLRPEPKKNILLAIGASPTGPFEVQGSVSTTNWAEGPSALNIDGMWYVYADLYRKGHFGAIRSKDLKTWETITEKLCMPAQSRHGTMFEVDAEILKKMF